MKNSKPAVSSKRGSNSNHNTRRSRKAVLQREARKEFINECLRRHLAPLEEEYKREGWEDVYCYDDNPSNKVRLVMDKNGNMAYARDSRIVVDLTLAESVRWHMIAEALLGAANKGDAWDRWQQAIAEAIEYRMKFSHEDVARALAHSGGNRKKALNGKVPL